VGAPAPRRGRSASDRGPATARKHATAYAQGVSDPPQATLTLSGGYYFHTINRLIGQLEPLFELDRSNTQAVITIDLRNLTFIGPAGVALLVATLHRLRERRLTLTGGVIYPPVSPGMRTYLHRIDFYKRLFADEGWPDHVERGEPLGMRECKHFPSDPEDLEWSSSLRTVTLDILAAIEELVSTDDAAHTSLDLALSEITENVGYHADTLFGGFAAVQALRHSNEVEVAIVDLGVGIASSLRRNPTFASAATDDLTAIRTALTATVTATPWRNSGYGLTFTQLLLALNEGRLLVRSGKGHVIRGAKTSDRLVKPHLPGTLVGLRLRTDRPLDFHAAYDALGRAIQAVTNRLSDVDSNRDPHREAG
jgi:anti-sigma regulatory factor (Ser/Thr protein kinase)